VIFWYVIIGRILSTVLIWWHEHFLELISKGFDCVFVVVILDIMALNLHCPQHIRQRC